MRASEFTCYALVCYISAYGFFTRFLYVEDATVLFHVFNYSELRPLFYYAGYISVLPQLVGYLASEFPFLIQALMYAIFPCVLSLWMVRRLFVLDISPYFVMALLGYLCVFDSSYFSNLSYSIWISVAVIGLILASGMRESHDLGYRDSVAILFLSLSSPLAITMLPGCVMIALRKGISINVALSSLILLVVPFALRDPGGNRTGSSSLVSDFTQNLSIIASDPATFLTLRGTNLPISVERVTEVFSLVCVLLVVAYLLVSLILKPKGEISEHAVILAPLVVGAFLCFVIGLGVASIPLGARYYFIAVIATASFLSVFSGSLNARYLSVIGFTVAIGAIAITGYRLQSDLPQTFANFRSLVTQACPSKSVADGEDCIGDIVLRHKNWHVALIQKETADVIASYCVLNADRQPDSFMIFDPDGRYVCDLPD